MTAPADPHSYSNPHQIRVTHADLNLAADFQEKRLRGYVTLSVERAADYIDGPLVLDTRGLEIASATTSVDGALYRDTKYRMGPNDAVLGAPLTIEAPGDVRFVRIYYRTGPQASGLQWLAPAQTATRKHPFLYSQNQAIHARSWIPLQDTPAVRQTYSAVIHAPKELRAVMGAVNDPNAPLNGEFQFRMPNPVPAYLFALAIGNLDFKPLSAQTGVYAEPPLLAAAAREFEDTQRMINAAEELYGQYRWERYDILVMPPSFPYGGMENPRLTFVSPTMLAGDKSLVALIAHELAHSWSGNLVTNASWCDFWLNEGFTTYIERRIVEKVFGQRRSEMEALNEKQELEAELKTLQPRDQVLQIDLKGRDPDDGATLVPYVKGMLFLRLLEDSFGRERFDQFLRTYFEQHAFRSITTGEFVAYLKANLFSLDAATAATIPLDEWLTKPGLPAVLPRIESEALAAAETAAGQFVSNKLAASRLPVKKWTTPETVRFIRSLPANIAPARLTELDSQFRFSRSGNNEIRYEWLLVGLRRNWEPAMADAEAFLTQVGRNKYLKPLYGALAATPAGKKRAQAIYAKARPGYHPISQSLFDSMLR